MVRFFFGLSIVWGSLSAQGVISVDLNADQWVLSLVDPRDIYAVSPLASDPRYSYYASRGRGIRVYRGGCEALLDPRITVVVATGPLSPWVRYRLKKRTQVITLPSFPTLAELDQEWHRVACQLSERVRVRPHPLAPYQTTSSTRLGLIYGQSGISPGATSYLVEALSHAGFRSPLSQSSGWQTIPIESILCFPHTILFLLDDLNRVPPALRPYRRVAIPLSLTLCPHPLIARALVDHIGAIEKSHV